MAKNSGLKDVLCLNEKQGVDWAAIHGDCVSVAAQMPDNSVDFSVYSPPFLSIFTYSDSELDMGNCSSDDEFREHYSFLVREMLRIQKPGTLTAVHCSDLPSTMWKDGEIGLKDFMSDIVAAHKAAGWVFHSRITIRRDPVVERARTQALGLLYKQVCKDSSKSRVGMPDYLCVFRKPGERVVPVAHAMIERGGLDPDSEYRKGPSHWEQGFSVEAWQRLAEPVWMDIRQTRTINSSKESAVALEKDTESERHLCVLQLDVIENALFLWSLPGEIVFSPFMGVGSEGAMALKHRRKFIGTELKGGYFETACKHLAAYSDNAVDLFAAAE